MPPSVVDHDGFKTDAAGTLMAGWFTRKGLIRVRQELQVPNPEQLIDANTPGWA